MHVSKYVALLREIAKIPEPYEAKVFFSNLFERATLISFNCLRFSPHQLIASTERHSISVQYAATSCSIMKQNKTIKPNKV